MTVCADSLKLIINDDALTLLDAPSLLVAVYWIYNIEYLKTLKKTLTYLEHFVFKINQSSVIPTKLLRRHSDLMHILKVNRNKSLQEMVIICFWLH